MAGKNPKRPIEITGGLSARLVAGTVLLPLVFTLDAALVGQESATLCPSPIGIWSHEGARQARIIFSEIGEVRFDGRFAIYNSGSWELKLADSAAIMSISSRSFTSELLNRLEHGITARAGTAGPDSVNTAEHEVYYDLAESPCTLYFDNVVFAHESEPCRREREGNAIARRDSSGWLPARQPAIRFCGLRTSVWLFAGGEAPRMRMIFAENGRIRFDGGFDFYNPTYWELNVSGLKTVLSIRSPGFDPEMVVFEAHVDTEGFTGDPDSVHAATRTVYYDLSEARCYMNFAGWIFERQSELCND